MAAPPVSEHDREYFRKLARWKQEGHEEALREHLARRPFDRLAAGIALMLSGPFFETDPHELEGPSRFYEKAKELGLYRP